MMAVIQRISKPASPVYRWKPPSSFFATTVVWIKHIVLGGEMHEWDEWKVRASDPVAGPSGLVGDRGAIWEAVVWG